MNRLKSKKLKTKHVILGFLSFFAILYFISLVRKKRLADTALTTVCKVEDIRVSSRGTKRTKTTFAYIFYYLNNKKYSTRFRIKKGVEIGNCYEMIYSSENPKNIEVYFDKPIDCLSFTAN